jgi:hypothetical protein
MSIVSQGLEQMSHSIPTNESQCLSRVDWNKRQIISMKSQGFSETPQDIMEENNGCSVPQYTAYRGDRRLIEGCREGFKQILNWWESAHARFEARPSCT